MRGRIRLPALLAGNARGATTVEFALVLLPLLVFIMGGLEYGWRAFAISVLQGETDRAGRTSETETSTNAQIDATLTASLKAFAPASNIAIARASYEDFGHIRPETLTFDANGNGKWDKGDCFIDANSNGGWDADLGSSGKGGAQDVVLYTVVMTYPTITPIASLIGGSKTVSLTATTLVKNQPFAAQSSYNYQDASTPKCL